MNIIIKWLLGQVQDTWHRAVKNPKTTFTGFAGAGAIVGIVEYMTNVLHCDLGLLDIGALYTAWLAMRNVDATNMDEHDKVSQA